MHYFRFGHKMIATAVKMNNALILENRVNLIFYILYKEINFFLSIVWQWQFLSLISVYDGRKVRWTILLLLSAKEPKSYHYLALSIIDSWI